MAKSRSKRPARRSAPYNGTPRSANARVGVNNTDTVFKRPFSVRRRKRTKGVPLSTKVRNLEKKVREVKKDCTDEQSTLTHRSIRAFNVAAQGGKTHWSNTNFSNRDEMKASLTKVTVIDASNPAQPIEVDLSAGSYAREISCNGCTGKATFYNTNQGPVEIWAYIVAPRTNGSEAPLSSFTQGLNELPVQKLVPAPTQFNAENCGYHHYPTDSKQFNENWRIIKSSKFILQPGDSVSMSHSTKPFNFPVVGENSKYQPSLQNFAMLFRVCGPWGPDASDQLSTAAVNVHIKMEVVHKWSWVWGIPTHDVRSVSLIANPPTTQINVPSKPDVIINTLPIAI